MIFRGRQFVGLFCWMGVQRPVLDCVGKNKAATSDVTAKRYPKETYSSYLKG